MDDASAAVIEQGGMPSGDDAAAALTVMDKHSTFSADGKYMALDVGVFINCPIDFLEQWSNIHQCLIAYVALMRMHEAKKEHGLDEKPKH